jgi:hypothetical protein
LPTKTLSTIFQRLMPVAREGKYHANERVGEMYENGEGVTQNIVKAEKYFEKERRNR